MIVTLVFKAAEGRKKVSRQSAVFCLPEQSEQFRQALKSTNFLRIIYS